MLELYDISWSVPEGRQVLKNVSLSIADSGLTVITGPNGGGKTTLAKIIAGIVKPDSGRIVLDGEDITELDVTERARRGIAYAFQQPVRFKGITVRDLLEIASGDDLPEAELCSLLSKVGLCARDYKDRDVNASLSGGEIKRVEIASVLARKAKLTIFDEPEAGIDLWSFTGLIEAFQESSVDFASPIYMNVLNVPSQINLLNMNNGDKYIRMGIKQFSNDSSGNRRTFIRVNNMPSVTQVNTEATGGRRFTVKWDEKTGLLYIE